MPDQPIKFTFVGDSNIPEVAKEGEEALDSLLQKAEQASQAAAQASATATQKAAVSIQAAVKMAQDALQELVGAGVNVEAVNKMAQSFGRAITSSFSRAVMGEALEDVTIDTMSAIQQQVAEEQEKQDRRRETRMAQAEQGLTRLVERAAASRVATVTHEVEQEVTARERGIMREIADLQAHRTQLMEGITRVRETIAAEQGVPRRDVRSIRTAEINAAFKERQAAATRIIELEKALADERERIFQATENRRAQFEAGIRNMEVQGQEAFIRRTLQGDRELAEQRLRNAADMGNQLAAFDARLEAGRADAVVQATQRRTQANRAADEAYLRTVESLSARVAGVVARSEAVRTQAGAQGAQQRIQRLADVEAQATKGLEAAHQRRLRAQVQAAVEEARIVSEYWTRRVAAVRGMYGAESAIVREMEAQETAATQRYATMRTGITQQETAERLAAQRELAQGMESIGRQMAAERTAIATAGAAAGGGGGGGFFGGLGTLVGGGGGWGGFFGGLGGMVSRGLSGVAGKAWDILKGVPGTILSGLQTGLTALTAPVRLVAEGFTSIFDVLGKANTELTHFISLGLGLYGMYQIVETLRRTLEGLVMGAVEFQDRLVQVQSLRLGDQMVHDMTQVSDAVLEVSMRTGRSATELGQALFFVEGHGYDAADALNILNQAAMLSASGLGETDQLVRIGTGAMVAYGAAASEASRYFDVLARTEQLAALPLGELAGQFQRIVPVAAALHIPIEQVGTLIATLSRTGLNASRVITDLTGVLNSFVHATPAQQKALESIGYPLEVLREELTDPNKGIVYVLTKIWDQSNHDIDIAGQIFSDRSRALVGFLGVIRNSGQDVNDVFDEMAKSAGTTARVFEINQERISLQWNRLTATAQAFAILVSETVLPALARMMDPIIDALQEGRFADALEGVGRAFTSIASGILETIGGLAEKMFGAGANIVGELARGMWDAATNILNAVVSGIADLIASFLLGASPPPRGALSKIPQGVAAWNRAYADAMAANGTMLAGAASNVATQVNAELAKIGSLQGMSAEGLQAQISSIEAQLLPWELAAENIKAHYQDMLDPLERQIDAIERIKDLEYERKQLVFDQRQLELDMLKLRSEGDPIKRARLAGQLERAQYTQEGHRIAQQMATLQRRLREPRRKGESAQEYALERISIRDELAVLRIRQQQHQLTNIDALARYTEGQSKLDSEKDSAELQHRAFELQKQMTLQPLIEQRDKINAQMQAELDYIEQQTQGLNNQKRLLEAQLGLLKQRDKAAGGGAGGTPWQMPDVDDLRAKNEAAINKSIGNLADTMRDRIGQAFNDFMIVHGPRIGQALTGFIVGGMVGGIPGAIAGALFVPKLMDELAKRGVQAEDLVAFVERVKTALGEAWAKAKPFFDAGNILGTIESLRGSVGEWIDAFQRMFFAEWFTRSISGTGAMGVNARSLGTTVEQQKFLEANAFNVVEGQFTQANVVEGAGSTGGPQQRWTGLGRTIIEAMFGQQDENLNFQTAAALVNEKIIQPVRRAIEDAWQKFAINRQPIMTEGFSTQGPVLMSQAERLGRAILDFINSAFVWMSEHLGEPSEALGRSLGGVIGSAVGFMMSDKQTHDTLFQGFKTLGADMGFAFISGFAEDFGTNLWNAIRPGGTQIATGERRQQMQQQQAAAAAAGQPILRTRWDAIFEDVGKWIEAGKNAVSGFVGGSTSEEATKMLNDAGLQTANTYLAAMTSEAGLDMNTPSRATQKLGEGAVEGFNQGIVQNGNTTGPIVRTWLDNEVLAQARLILMGGQRGQAGGLKGIAQDAVDDMNTVFSSGPSPTLTNSLDRFGASIVTDIMNPIKSPSTGLVAELKRVLQQAQTVADAARITTPTPAPTPRTPITRRTPVPDEGITPDMSAQSMTLTSEERTAATTTQVTRGGSTYNMAFNIDGGNPDEVQRAVAAGVAQALDDSDGAVPGQFLSAWRAAKAQSTNGGRPLGVQQRNARG